MSKIDLFDSVFYIILGCIVFVCASNNTADFTAVGPAFFPRMIATAMIAVNVIRLILLFYSKSKWKNEYKSANREGVKSFLLIIVSLLAYYLMNYLVGFPVATVIFVFCLCYLLGEKKIIHNIVYSLAISGIITSIFKWILVLPLPQGIIL